MIEMEKARLDQSIYLEAEVAAELYVSRAVGSCTRGSEGSVLHACIHAVPCRMVEDVQELGLQSQVHALINGNDLRERCICVDPLRIMQPHQITEGSRVEVRTDIGSVRPSITRIVLRIE